MNDLNKYLITLGKLALTAKILDEEQNDQAKSGILQPEEMECSESVTWAVDKLLDMIDAQVRLVTSRTCRTWEETLEEIKKDLNG